MSASAKKSGDKNLIDALIERLRTARDGGWRVTSLHFQPADLPGSNFAGSVSEGLTITAQLYPSPPPLDPAQPGQEAP